MEAPPIRRVPSSGKEARDGRRCCALRWLGRAPRQRRCHGAGAGEGQEPAPPRAADAELRHHDRSARAARRLATGLRGDAGRDGGDRRLLEARLLGARAAVRVLALERAAPAQRARAEERPDRLRLVLPAARARAGAPELRPAAGDPAPARPDPPTQHPDRGALARDPAAGEGAPGRRDQVLERRFEDVLGLGARAKGKLRRRSRIYKRRSRTGSSSPTTASWSRSSSPTSTHWTRRSPTSTAASPRPPTPTPS